MNSSRIEWEAPEFEYREKKVSWYWLSIIIAVLVLGFSVWRRNFLFGVFVVLAEILILVWGNRKPDMVMFVLNDTGLTIGEQKNYPYSDITGFAIEDDESGGRVMLTLQFKKKLKPNARMEVPKERLGEVKGVLGKFVDEIEIQKSLIDTLEEFLGF